MNTLNSVFYCHCQSVTTLSAKPQTFSVTVPCLPCLQLGTHYYLNYISGFQEKSVLPFEKKMKYSLKHRSQRQKYMMMVCIMSQKSWRLIFNWKKNIIRNSKLLLVFLFQLLCAMRFLIDDKFFWQSVSHPTTRNLNVKFLYDILITWWLF